MNLAQLATHMQQRQLQQHLCTQPLLQQYTWPKHQAERALPTQRVEQQEDAESDMAGNSPLTEGTDPDESLLAHPSSDLGGSTSQFQLRHGRMDVLIDGLIAL